MTVIIGLVDKYVKTLMTIFHMLQNLEETFTVK